MAIRAQQREDNRTARLPAQPGADPVRTSARHLVHQSPDLHEDLALLMTAMNRRSDRSEQKKNAPASDRFSQLLEDNAEASIVDVLQVITRTTSTGGEVLDFARQRFADISDLVLALEEMLEQYGAGELEFKRAQERNKISEAIAAARAGASRKWLQGGINAGVKVRVFSSKTQLSPKVLRNLYRGFLDAGDDGLDLYQRWIEEYGLDRRHALVDFIGAVLISDIHSLDPSCSSIEFNSLLGCNTRLRLIRSSDGIIVNMLRDDSLFASRDDRDACLLKLLFDILDSPFEVETAFIEQLGYLFASMQATRRALCLQRIRHAFRQLSPDLFINEELHFLVMDKLDQFADLSAEREKPTLGANGGRP